MKTILIIDDDMHIGNMLEEVLLKEGYRVQRAYSGTEALLLLKNAAPDLILLDLMLPGLNGEELLPRIKGIPVIVVSAKTAVESKVSLLLNGACDYLTKPFSGSEFLARVSSLLRRYTVFNTADISKKCVTAGRLEIDQSGHRVCKDDVPLDLTAKEFDLLVFFAQNPGRVFTKKQIYRAVWQDEYSFDDNNIMVHIRRLRKKIEDNPENPQYILAVWGVGYKFNGETG